jgi:hypothetical protein
MRVVLPVFTGLITLGSGPPDEESAEVLIILDELPSLVDERGGFEPVGKRLT